MRVVLALALLPITASAQTLSPADETKLCAAQNENSAALRTDVHRLQGMVDDLRAQLLMHESVQVSVVPSNTQMASVEPLGEEEAVFHLSLDESFLHCVSEEELTAALAHELGHVWVFTHHPYLQTEALANEIAVRLVPRDSLVRLYETIRQWQATGGDLVPLVAY
jgi:hypothetical protein